MKRFASFFLIAALAACHDSTPSELGSLHGSTTISGANNVALNLVGPTVRELSVDVEGTFTATALPAGAYVLYANADATREQSVRRDVVVIAGNDTAVPSIDFTAIAYVKGSAVVAGEEQPAGSLVTASDGSSTLTAADGTFLLAVDCTATSIVVTRSGYTPATHTLTSLARGETYDVGPLQLAKGDETLASFAGVARVAGSTDPSGIEVRIDALGLTTTTGADGSFSFSAVPPGAYDVVWTRGDATEAVHEVLIGLGTPKAYSPWGFRDLTTIELAARRRITQDLAYCRLTSHSTSGRYVAEQLWDTSIQAAVRDTTTDQVVMQFRSAEGSSLGGPPVQFTGEIALAIVADDVGYRSLATIDPATNTTTTVLDHVAWWFHAPKLGLTLVANTDPTPLLYAVPWATREPRLLGPQLSVSYRQKTYTVLIAGENNATTLEWRDLATGTLIQKKTYDGPISQYRNFNPSESLMTIPVGDHWEAWSADQISVSPALVSSGMVPSADGKYVWSVGNYSSAKKYDAGTWELLGTTASIVGASLPEADNASVLSPSVDTTGATTITRYALDGSPGEVIATVKNYAAEWAVVDNGMWFYGASAILVPAGGDPIVIADVQDPKIDESGRLVYARGADGADRELHRVSPTGEDTTLDTGLLTYAFVTPDVLQESRRVGDRIEQSLFRLGGTTHMPLGTDVGGVHLFSATDFYVTRSSDAALYVNGLWRGALAP